MVFGMRSETHHLTGSTSLFWNYFGKPIYSWKYELKCGQPLLTVNHMRGTTPGFPLSVADEPQPRKSVELAFAF